MILSFLNIARSLGFQHSPQDLVNVNEWKIMFDPYIIADIVEFVYDKTLLTYNNNALTCPNLLILKLTTTIYL